MLTSSSSIATFNQEKALVTSSSLICDFVCDFENLAQGSQLAVDASVVVPRCRPRADCFPTAGLSVTAAAGPERGHPHHAGPRTQSPTLHCTRQ